MFTVTWVIQAGQSSGGATRNARSTVVSFQLQLVMAWMLRAGVAVVAGQGIGRVHAARAGIARIRRADVAVAADGRRAPTQTLLAQAVPAASLRSRTVWRIDSGASDPRAPLIVFA